MNAKELEKTLEILIEANSVPMIWGPPGVGKSQIVRQVAEKMGYTVIDVRVSLLDPTDLRGIPVVMNGRTVWAPPIFWPAEDGKKYLIFFDELPNAAPMMQSACYQIILDRMCGEYRLPESTRLVAAGNRETDRTGVTRMLTALANRMVHIDLVSDHKCWIEWAQKKGLSEEIVYYIAFRPSMLNNFYPKTNPRAFASGRSWEDFDGPFKIYKNGSTPCFPRTLLHQIGQGRVGDEAATDFMGFLEIFKSLPDPRVFLKNPDSPFPEPHGVLLALCAALSKLVDENTMKELVHIALRLRADRKSEYAAMLVNGAVIRYPDLKETVAYINWLEKTKRLAA